MKYFIILLFVSFFYSCNINKISSALYDMKEKKVCFKDLEPILLGKELSTGSINLSSKDARLVVYFDSTSCQSCRVNKLYEWNNIIEIESESRGEFEIIFIFSPSISQKALLKRSLAVSKFAHVVWFDYNNYFFKNNTFIPKDNRFHVFLLDKNNKIVFVGNPLYGEKIAKLFNQVLENLIENDGEYKENGI